MSVTFTFAVEPGLSQGKLWFRYLLPVPLNSASLRLLSQGQAYRKARQTYKNFLRALRKVWAFELKP